MSVEGYDAYDLTAKLYEGIAKNNQWRQYDKWHASAIAQCPRAQFLNRKGVKPLQTPGAGKILRWGIGHIVETAIRPYLQDLYPNLQSNQRLEHAGLNLTGEYDNYDPDSKTIIEIKSVHPNAVRYKRLGEDRHHVKGDQPYLSHEWQEHAYVLLMDRHNIPVENITYVYVSLSGLLVIYNTPVDNKLVSRVAKKVDYMNKCWEENKLPICTCSETDELWGSCLQYCDYRTEDGCCDEKLIKEVK